MFPDSAAAVIVHCKVVISDVDTKCLPPAKRIHDTASEAAVHSQWRTLRSLLLCQRFKESVIVLVLLSAYALYAGYLSKELW